MKKLIALLLIAFAGPQLAAQENNNSTEMGLLRLDLSAGIYTTKDIRNGIEYNSNIWGKNSPGTYFATIGFFRYQKIEVGITAGYQEAYIEDTPVDQLDVTYFSFLPQIRFNWVTSPDNRFELYSSVALGLTRVMEDDKTPPNRDESYFVPGFHINGIGLRFGNKFGGFMELGFGSKGLMSVGLSYRM